MKAALRSSKQIGPNIPSWRTTFPFPGRLRSHFYGIADSAVDPYTLLQCEHDFPPAKVAKWAALTPKPVLQLRWETSRLWDTPGSTAMSASYYAGVKYVVQAYLNAGMNVSLGPQDNIRGVNGVYTQLHQNVAGAHYNWQWLADGWVGLVQQLRADLLASGFGPDRVTIEVVNELGNGVDSGLLSMATYNSMWAYVIPRMRAGLPDYTFLIDTYHYAAENHYIATGFAENDGTLLVLPSNDRNLVLAMHCYRPSNFTQQGIGGTDNWDRLYISGMQWGWTKAQISSYLTTYDAGGQYHTGNALLDAQVDYWRNPTNQAVQIETLGFTRAELLSNLSGILAYCATNKRALCCPQWSCLAAGSSTFPLASAQVNAYESAMSQIFYEQGIPHSYWLEQTLTDDVLRLDPSNVGSESFVPSRIAANVARTPPR